mgnify:CR=1 FL=1
MRVFNKIIELLDKNNIKYEIKEHKETYTSEQAAEYRGEDLKIGAKAMILKGDDFLMCVISAARRINSKKVREIINCKKLRFATKEEVIEKTGCVPGSVPPFGNIFGLRLLVDESLLENEYIAFNAGMLTKSIKMKKDDYLKMVNAEICDFSE